MAPNVPSPGSVIRGLMDEYHVDAQATAAMADIDIVDLEAILAGAERIGARNAYRLETTFGPSATFWLALDERYHAGTADA